MRAMWRHESTHNHDPKKSCCPVFHSRLGLKTSLNPYTSEKDALRKHPKHRLIPLACQQNHLANKSLHGGLDREFYGTAGLPTGNTAAVIQVLHVCGEHAGEGIRRHGGFDARVGLIAWASDERPHPKVLAFIVLQLPFHLQSCKIHNL